MQQTKTETEADHTRGAPRTVIAQLVLWTLYVVLAAAVLAFLAVLLPGPLYHIRVLSLGGAFRSITYGAYGGLVTTLLGVVLLPVVWVVHRGARRFIAPALVIVLGGIAWGVPYMWLKKGESVPPIHDITTDTRNPPQFLPDVVALRAAAHATNSTVYGGPKVAALQKKAYPYIRPMFFKLPASKVFAAALRTVKSMGWKLDSAHPHLGIIEASSTTFWFGFTDDVVIRIESQASGSRLDIRSESRIGESDFGRNAARIMRFRAMLYRKLGLGAPAA
ncbi:MAG: DUF1499 domain-containing protein [Steroidobacteraceae bacterium]